MMRRLAHIVLAAMLTLVPQISPAQNTPVVVELYTSQGCSACPRADELLNELGEQSGVIALALHVDYWDYLGWRDVFGQPAFTARQRSYAKAARERSIFTPQMIIQGQDRLIGHDADAVNETIRLHQGRPITVQMHVTRSGQTLEISLSPVGAPVGGTEVHVVEIMPSHAMTIEAGENAGHNFTYSNIVTGWSTVARWDGATPWEFRHEGVDPGPVAVIVQRERLGPVLSAAMLP